VASSRLRAIETGRWVAQVSPTGFTAFVSPSGDVYQRTGQVERAVRVRTIDRRLGLTPYTVLGDKPFVIAMLLALLFMLRRGARALAPEETNESPEIAQSDISSD
jgi:apolipoprotein N-acyltransferase